MGRPIQKKWFGLPTLAGAQIVVNGVKFKDGTTSTSAYILKQTGSNAYVVQDVAKSHAPEIVFMVNASSTGALNAGECFILATPFGGSARPCAKISQFRLSLYEADGTVNDYSWSTIPATAPGQADLISGAGAAGAILTVTVGVAGNGYFTAPSVSFTGGGIGASATASVSAGSVTGIVVNAGGSGYATGGVTLSAPPASVQATATATQSGGVVNSVTPVLGGGYYVTAPNVTVLGTGADAVVTATVANGAVTGYTIVNGGTGYNDPVVIFVDAPPAAVQATASATISS